MYQDLLELPQRVIAFARIGMRPSPADIEAAINRIDQAQSQMRRIGRTSSSLDPAKAVLTTLRWGHLPRRNDCIAAVSTIAYLMATAETVAEE